MDAPPGEAGQIAHELTKLSMLVGRDDWIRTSDLTHPKGALYQAEPRPDTGGRMAAQRCACSVYTAWRLYSGPCGLWKWN